MKFSFKTRTVDGIVVMDLSGRMVIGEPLEPLHTAIQEAVAAGSLSFLLDIGAVEVMDSTGLSTLRNCLVTITDHKGRLKLLRVPDRILTVLRVTGFLRFLETFEDEQTALASFKPQ